MEGRETGEGGEMEGRETGEGERKGPTYCLVVSLTVGQPFLLVVPATFEWFLTVRTHKVLEEGGGRGGGRGGERRG